MNKYSFWILVTVSLLLLGGCKKDDDTPGQEPPVVTPSSTRVLVSCEGSFGASNASLSAYDSSDMISSDAVFESINGFAPGDVLQSMANHGGKHYLVVNGSSSIQVVDESSLEAEAPINGLVSPRMILPVSESKAYVSNLFTNDVQIVDLATKTVVGAVTVNGWSEGMIAKDGKLFVAKSNGDKVMVVDMSTDLLIDSIVVGEGPINLVEGSAGNLWVLTNGNFGSVTPLLSRIDPVTHTAFTAWEIPAPWSYQMVLRINGAGDDLYVLNGGVYTIPTSLSALSTEPLIDNGFSNYGLGVDPDNGDIYLGYAPDFSSAGQVYRYASDGTEIDDFSVGIAPNGFLFED